MVRTSFIIFIFCLTASLLYGQELKKNKIDSLVIDPLLRSDYYNGDTLSIKIKNISSTDKVFTIEVVSLSKEPYYYNATYTAFLNKDTLFFIKLRATKKASRKNKIAYVLPGGRLNPYTIKGNTERTIDFIIKGTPQTNGNLLSLRMNIFIDNWQYETFNSKSFYVFSLPE